ncbi:MAG: type IV pili methyl-accepting chemotaxis transducer N-terminal domain-containing protein, partial [Lysobacterales bacterium]
MSAAAGGIQQRESSTPIITILVALFIGALVVFAANFVQQVVRSTQDQRATALAADIQVKSQQLAKYAAEAADGRIEAFDELRQTQSLIATNLEQLSSGDPTTDVPPISANPEVEPALTQVVSTWTEIAAASSNILAKEDIVLEMTDIQSQ